VLNAHTSKDLTITVEQPVFVSKRILHEHRLIDHDSQAWSLRKVQIALFVH
jgi:hypothetical protein